jgi:hypothetical protein
MIANYQDNSLSRKDDIMKIRRNLGMAGQAAPADAGA